MIKQISLALAFILTSTAVTADSHQPVYHDPASEAETTGAIAGAIFGGIAGGPPGLIFGAAFGALFDEGRHAKSNYDKVQGNLYKSQLRLATLQTENQAMQERHQLILQRLEGLPLTNVRTYDANIYSPTADCCDNTILSLNFRSGSSVIEMHYEQELASLIKIVEQMPAANLDIIGYSDRTGTPELNLKLSHERSNSVKKFLNSRGIRNSSMQTIYHGDTRPLHFNQNFESDFFDRRVIVRLRSNSGSTLTKNSDGE
jgi:outer membrane protein OmpA-like peptidoglycan-associated protein